MWQQTVTIVATGTRFASNGHIRRRAVTVCGVSETSRAIRVSDATNPSHVAATPADAQRQTVPALRRAEMVVLFGVGPALLALGPRWMVTLGILSTGLLCGALLLFDRTFPRGALAGVAGARLGLRRVLIRAALVGAMMVIGGV